jgi:hypothetical protein
MVMGYREYYTNRYQKDTVQDQSCPTYAREQIQMWQRPKPPSDGQTPTQTGAPQDKPISEKQKAIFQDKIN